MLSRAQPMYRIISYFLLSFRLTHRGWAMHLYVGEQGHHCSRLLQIMPWCRPSWTNNSVFQTDTSEQISIKFPSTHMVFIQGNAFEIVGCKMFRPHYVSWTLHCVFARLIFPEVILSRSRLKFPCCTSALEVTMRDVGTQTSGKLYPT